MPSGLYRTTAKSIVAAVVRGPRGDDLPVRLQRHGAGEVAGRPDRRGDLARAGPERACPACRPGCTAPPRRRAFAAVVTSIPRRRSSRLPATPTEWALAVGTRPSVVTLPVPPKELSNVPSGLYRTTAKTGVRDVERVSGGDDLPVRLQRHGCDGCRSAEPIEVVTLPGAPEGGVQRAVGVVPRHREVVLAAVVRAPRGDDLPVCLQRLRRRRRRRTTRSAW